MRDPRHIEGLKEPQIVAYFKSFCQKLVEELEPTGKDKELDVLRRIIKEPWCPVNESLVKSLMAVYDKTYPNWVHYRDEPSALEYLKKVENEI